MNKRNSILAGILLSASFSAQDVSVIRNTVGVYDSNITTGTARYSAMAGSMGALGGDISSINSNPAGLGVFIAGGASASLNINTSKTSTSLAGNSISNTDSNASLGQIGGVLSFQTDDNSSWKFINVGINYINENIDSSIESPANHNIREPFISQGNIIDYNLYSGHLYARTGNRSKLSIGVAGNYDNKIYVGASASFSSVEIEQFDKVNIASLKNPTRSWVFQKQDTPFREDSGGFSIALGIIGKINNQIRLGASFESPTWYSIDREYQYYVNTANPNSIPSIVSYIGVENRSLRTPSKLMLSGAFIPNKNFALNIDYRLDLGKPQFSSNGNTETMLNNFYNSSYKAQNEIRLGGEYRNNGFHIRGGYSFSTSPFKNHTYEQAFNNYGIINAMRVSNHIIGSSQVISGGLGYDFKSFYIDATYQHRQQNYSNPFFDNLYVLNETSGYYLNEGVSIVSDAKTKQGNFIVTVGWRF